MTLARWFALGFVVLIILSGAGFLIAAEDIPARRAGFLPALCAGIQQRVVARGSLDDLDSPIQQIAASDDEVVLLAAHSWMVAVDGHILGPFGTATRGAPGYLGDAQHAAITDTAVFILDVASNAVQVFSKVGAFVRSRSLPRMPGVITQPRQVFLVNGQLYYTALEFGNNNLRWVLLGLRSESDAPQRLYETVGTSINGIVADHTEAGTVIGNMQTYGITAWSRDDAAATTVARLRPPLHPFSAKERRRYRGYWSHLPLATRAAFELPAYIPPLSGIKRISNSHFATLLAHDAELVHVEVLDDRARPVCRMTKTPLDRSVGLGTRGFHYIVEDADEMILMFAEYRYAADD